MRKWSKDYTLKITSNLCHNELYQAIFSRVEKVVNEYFTHKFKGYHVIPSIYELGNQIKPLIKTLAEKKVRVGAEVWVLNYKTIT